MTWTHYHPPGSELDCGIMVSENEWVRGFLRLADPHSPSRLRFIEVVPTLDLFDDEGEPFSLFLLDGPDGTPCAVADYFATSYRFGPPVPSVPFPVQITANTVIVGSDNADASYDSAAVRSGPLMQFLDSPALTPESVARDGGGEHVHFEAKHYGLTVSLVEVAKLSPTDNGATLEWFAEIRLAGPPRPLRAWSRSLTNALALFAFLLDRPLKPERIYSPSAGTHVDLYASWPPADAPENTVPLACVSEVQDSLGAIVEEWFRLFDSAPDLVNQLVEYQLHRDQHTLFDQVLLLSRCLELFHDFSDHESVIRPKADHRKIVAEVIENLPSSLAEKHEEWIERALQEANRKRLYDQMRDLMSALPKDVLEWCFIKDIDDFAAVARSSRNYWKRSRFYPHL